jgi:SPP1 gp7 family putative phage head morphogenesis protein
MIARTEIIRTYNQGAINQYKKVGVTKWKWLTAYDDRTCEQCASLDGKIFKMGAPQPPLHVNCRCSVAPYLDKKV